MSDIPPAWPRQSRRFCFWRSAASLLALADAGGLKNVGHRVIALVAGVFVDAMGRALHDVFRAPRLAIDGRVLDREAVEQLIRANQLEAFDDARAGAGASRRRVP